MSTNVTRSKLNNAPKKTLEKSNQKPSSSAILSTAIPPETEVVTGEPQNGSQAPKESKEILSVSPALLPPISDLQKKFRRAERFGLPLQLSEEERRNSRAQRFGTGTIIYGAPEIKQMEEQKKKARAERFGLSFHSSMDEETKKKARLARFAETLEEGKMKARAARFAQNLESVKK